MDIVLTFLLYNVLIFGYYGLVNRGIRLGNKVICFIFACLLCGIIAAFRGESGSDTLMYRTVYYGGANAVHRWESFEIGYVLLMKLFGALHLPFEAFLFFVGSFTTGFITCFIKNNAVDVDIFVICLAYTTDLYFFGFNGIRQMIAICICMLAIDLICRHKVKTGLLLVLIAIFFHRSAAVVLLTLFLKFMVRHERLFKFIILMGIATILFFILNRDILGKLVYFVTKSGYYESYVTRDAETGTNIFNYFLKQLPILLMSFFELMCRANSKEKTKIFSALALLGIVFSAIGSITQTQISRLGMYFSTFKIYVFGFTSRNRLYITKKKNISSGIVKTVAFLYLYALFIYNYFVKGFSEIVPYGPFR